MYDWEKPETYTSSLQYAGDLAVRSQPADKDEHGELTSHKAQPHRQAPARTHGRAAPETCRPAGPLRPHVARSGARLGHVISHARWPSPHLLTTAHSSPQFETKPAATANYSISVAKER